MTDQRPHYLLLALAIAALAAIAIGSLLPTLPAPLHRATLAIGNQHLFAYAVAAFLLGLAFDARLPRTLTFVVALACYGGVIEILQAYIPGRAGAMTDFWMNVAGAALGGGAAWLACLGRRAWLRTG